MIVMGYECTQDCQTIFAQDDSATSSIGVNWPIDFELAFKGENVSPEEVKCSLTILK